MEQTSKNGNLNYRQGEGVAEPKREPLPVESQSAGWKGELRKRIVSIEDEQQTFEDWVEQGNFAEARYYLTRMINEAEKCLVHLNANHSNAEHEHRQQNNNGGSEC